MAIVELSEKKYKNGRRPFKAVLYELQPPESVENGIGTKYNKNGITFLEEYCAPQLGSIADMSVRVEFLDENRTIICGHGETGVNEDGLITFRNASVVGHFTRGYITKVKQRDVYAVKDILMKCVIQNSLQILKKTLTMALP